METMKALRLNHILKQHLRDISIRVIKIYNNIYTVFYIPYLVVIHDGVISANCGFGGAHKKMRHSMFWCVYLYIYNFYIFVNPSVRICEAQFKLQIYKLTGTMTTLKFFRCHRERQLFKVSDGI